MNKSILNSYINFLSDLMAIDPPIVYFHENEKFFYSNGLKCEPFTLNESSMATTVPNENRIYVDLDKVNEDFIYPVLAHEIRHCYQYQAITNPIYFEPRSDEWKEEMDNYTNSMTEGYENQSIEIDANAFAKLIMNVVFKKDIIPKGDINRLNERYRELLEDYSYEEIVDSYQYACYGSTFN